MGKIIITGPGRSGTTFLVQLLTRLGFDTGYEPMKEPYSPEVRAGCEQRVELDLSDPAESWRDVLAEKPRILKSPEWGLVLKHFVQEGIMEVDHVFIPVRDLDEAAKSRLSVGLEWQVCETDDYAYKVMDQASVHALALGRALEACLVCGLPHTLMMFPHLVQDWHYCYEKLSEGLDINKVDFWAAYRNLARPKEVE